MGETAIPRRHAGTPTRRSGQAMTEFVVVLAALTGVGLLIGYLFLGDGSRGSGGSNVIPAKAIIQIEQDKEK